MTVLGTVINIHHLGATVRLEDGSLATISLAELVTNRSAFASSLARRQPLELVLTFGGRHRSAALATSARQPTDALALDEAFEARMDAYLKATQEWAPSDQTPPAERHFIRKKRRARLFEARTDSMEKPPL